MEINYIIGYTLAVLVGVSLGLIGSGGSILSVPILVYIMKVEPVLATAYSLFTVGITALFGGIKKAQQKNVDFKKVLLFGIPTVISVYITRKFIVPNIPQTIDFNFFVLSKSALIMVVFAIVMLFASIRMIRPTSTIITSHNNINYFKIIAQAVLIGLIAGFVGAGGGFLIIPVLLFYAHTPMKKAIGTSLFIIAIQSLLGFIGDLQTTISIDWKLLISFTFAAIIGIFIGNYLSKKISGEKLKTSFGWFVLVMGVYIIIKELVLN